MDAVPISVALQRCDKMSELVLRGPSVSPRGLMPLLREAPESPHAPNLRKHDVIIAAVFNGAFHMIKRSHSDTLEPGKMNNISGHREPREPYPETLEREALEEAGINLAGMHVIPENALKAIGTGTPFIAELGIVSEKMGIRRLKKGVESTEPSLVTGMHYLLYLPGLDPSSLQLSREHTSIQAFTLTEILANGGAITTFDMRYYELHAGLFRSIGIS